MLNLANISLRRGRNLLIRNASLQVHAGQRTGLIGANGSGKSSLFAMLLGELEPDDGELGLRADDQIAHVAQESPHGSGSAVDYVLDGDSELRELQAAIADGEKTADAGKVGQSQDEYPGDNGDDEPGSCRRNNVQLPPGALYVSARRESPCLRL